MGEEKKKVVFISGPITGVEKYWEPFEKVENELVLFGYIPLSPAHLPCGMCNAQYMRICTAMIDTADVVLFLPGWNFSKGSSLEMQYCEYINKPTVVIPDRCKSITDEVRALIRNNLEAVMK